MSFLLRHATVHFDDFLIIVNSKTKVSKVTTSNTRNLKGILTFILQTFLVLFYWTMSFLCRHDVIHFDDFLILVISKTKVFKVTTSNTMNLKGILSLGFRGNKYEEVVKLYCNMSAKE